MKINIGVYLVAVAVFGLILGAFGVFNKPSAGSQIRPEMFAGVFADYVQSAGVFAEVYETTTETNYTLCGTDMRPDSEVILVSSDLGKCGDSMTVVLVDGSVVSAPISGVLHGTHDKRVEIYNLDTPQVTLVYKH
jgi:hypothetical protein